MGAAVKVGPENVVALAMNPTPVAILPVVYV